MNVADIRWIDGTGAIMVPDDGTFPGNPSIPLVIHKGLLPLEGDEDARTVEHLFSSNSWGDMWRNGIFSYQHYHSTAHEALGVYRGSATVQLGGPSGIVVEICRGDAVFLPAGTAHMLLSKDDLAVVGAYPPGPPFDLMRGLPGERPDADRNIAGVPLPPRDPVLGAKGPLFER